MTHCSARTGRLAVVGSGLLLVAAGRAPAAAQLPSPRTFTACTPGALTGCAELRLTAGPSLFEIALRAVGVTGAPAVPISVYNLVLGTGAAAVGTPVPTLLGPIAEGGATVSNASDWEVFDAGDALFLSALSNRGVGGCATGADVGGFGQAATTCGGGQFVTFRFAPSAAFDPDRFTLLDLEVVALEDPLRAATCGGEVACVITADTRGPVTMIPEPATVALVGAGVLALGSRSRLARTGVGASGRRA